MTVTPSEMLMTGGIQVKQELSLKQLAETFARSGFFKDASEMSKAVVKIMAGHELGFAPVVSMTGIHIIEGKITLGSHLLASLIRQHPDYDYRIKTHTNTECVLDCYFNGELIGQSSFTMDDAKTAGLTGKQGSPWTKYPRNMLFARALSNAHAFHFPDALSGGRGYMPEEVGMDAPEAQSHVEVSVDPDDAQAVGGDVQEGEYVEVTEPPESPVEAPPAPSESNESPDPGEGGITLQKRVARMEQDSGISIVPSAMKVLRKAKLGVTSLDDAKTEDLMSYMVHLQGELDGQEVSA